MAELMEDFDFIHGTADNPNPMYVRLGEYCNVAVAQLVFRASVWYTEGRWFESNQQHK